MRFDEKTMQIQLINATDPTDLGSYMLMIEVSDRNGDSTMYSLQVQIAGKLTDSGYFDYWGRKKLEKAPPVELKKEQKRSYSTGKVKARIESVSTTGLVDIRFSQDLNSTFNASYFTSENMNLTLYPDTSNFTWETIEFKNDLLKIQLNLSSPFNISKNHLYDQLKVNFTQRNFSAPREL